MTFQHRAGVSPYTSPFGFAETCVFAKQSLGPLLCDRVSPRFPLSRSYGVILPSSLTTLLPSDCGFSPRLPVSVYGTGAYIAIADFLDSVDSETSLLIFAPRHISPLTPYGFACTGWLYAWPGISIPRFSYPPVSPQF